MKLAGRVERLEVVQTVAPLAVRNDVLLDRLYRTHAPAALRFALMLTGERELSEDLSVVGTLGTSVVGLVGGKGFLDLYGWTGVSWHP